MNSHADIYEKITTSILEAIGAGCDKLEMPWHAMAARPQNASTQRHYRGINVLVLWAAALKYGYATHLWATYQQWHELGAQVRKSERSTAVVFWKFYDVEETETDEQGGCSDAHRRCFARAYHVFNAGQVDGFEIPEASGLPEQERIERAEAFFRNTGAHIIEEGCEAYYDYKRDEIHMPPFAFFKTADLFYGTLAHEAIHFSGHESRCNRQLKNRFGSEAYAVEELIAELGSAFLCSNLQVQTEPRSDHAPYIQNWLKK